MPYSILLTYPGTAAPATQRGAQHYPGPRSTNLRTPRTTLTPDVPTYIQSISFCTLRIDATDDTHSTTCTY